MSDNQAVGPHKKHMKLFTITVHFSDHRIGIGQHRAETPYESLLEFLNKSESLEGYPRDVLLKTNKSNIIHIADNLLGFWSWHPNLSSNDLDPLDEVLGGHIIQTAENGPKRG